MQTAIKAVGFALAVLAAASSGRAQQVAYTGSVNYANGDYIFTERTSSVYLFNGISVSSARLSVAANLPLIYQTTPWVSYSTIGAIPSGGSTGSDAGRGSDRRSSGATPTAITDTATYSDFGIGDPTIHAGAFVVTEGSSRPSIQLFGDVKIPVADVERGFGTGAWDFGAGLNLSKGLGRTFITAGVAYWALGDMPDLELKENIGYGVSVGWLPGYRVAAVVSFSGYTQIIEGQDPPLLLTAVGSYLFSAGRSLSASIGLGLTESSPDFSLGIGWRVGM